MCLLHVNAISQKMFKKRLMLTNLQKPRVARRPVLLDPEGAVPTKDDNGEWVDNGNIKYRWCEKKRQNVIVLTQRELDPKEREANKYRLCKTWLLRLQKPSKYQDIGASQFGQHDCTKCGERRRDGKKLQSYLSCKKTRKPTWIFRPLSEEHPDKFLPSAALITQQLTLNGQLQNRIRQVKIDMCLKRLLKLATRIWQSLVVPYWEISRKTSGYHQRLPDLGGKSQYGWDNFTTSPLPSNETS